MIWSGGLNHLREERRILSPGAISAARRCGVTRSRFILHIAIVKWCAPSPVAALLAKKWQKMRRFSELTIFHHPSGADAAMQHAL
jgi:hypothetical protein